MSILTKLRTLFKPPFKVELFVDGMLWETVPFDAVPDLKLTEGMQLSDELRIEIRHYLELYEAKEFAMRLLAQRERSAGEIRQRLQQKKLGDCADEVIQSLQKIDYLNDERFARLFTRDKINLNHWGPQRIRTELFAKGVSKDIIQRTIEDAFEKEDQQLTITTLVEKKLKGKKAITDKERQRVWNFLIRRGFASSEISVVLAKYERLRE